ncbi:hypothetical protein ACHAXR_005032 [Thalassiosira sp. AJA248-18]
MGSSQSSMEKTVGSSATNTVAAAADCGKDSVQLSATQNSKEDFPVGLNGGNLSEQPKQYTPPSGPIKPLAHYIFLVHGWLGNDAEMGYLETAFQNIISNDDSPDNTNIPDAKRAKRSTSRLTQQMLAQQEASSSATGESNENNYTEHPEIIVHSVKCNVGKTHDGIRNGGTRLANEMINFIRADVQKRLLGGGVSGDDNGDDNGDENNENNKAKYHDVTYSLIGNSLGGLYSRYAISLLPYQLQLQTTSSPSSSSSTPMSASRLNLHPNIFCTTATPHLGVSRHTYLPIPRIAETIIGTGLGTTGRDLFRLNSEKDIASAAAGGIAGGIANGVRRLSALRPKGEGGVVGDKENPDATNNEMISNDDEDEMECIIRNMCLQDKYLMPLRSFRRRIAYANAYGTDFQVPTETAAFLNAKSGVGHFVIASRDLPSAGEGGEDVGLAEGSSTESKRENGGTVEDDTDEKEEVPPFIVAVVRTEIQSQPQSPSPTKPNRDLADELLRMSQSLDALGWTKVFIDVRDRIPVPGFAKPAWLRPQCGSLDDLIHERAKLSFASLAQQSQSVTSNADAGDGAATKSPPKVETSEELCILTSQELAQHTKDGDSINFPLGHTVMVANSKSEQYSKLNSQGRPVMDKLAEDMIHDVLEFE